MSENTTPPSVVDQDYEDIQAAVMETGRGRWFLNEFAQRNRVADTQILLDAIKKLESMVAEKETTGSPDPDVEKIRFDIVDMANAIALTKQEIAGINSGDNKSDDSRLDVATAELDAIVVAAETATSDILSAAENIQEVAWTMREDGTSEADFDKLDGLATDIYMACSFQDITGQRTSKVIGVLQFLESRITAMMDIWGIENPDHVAVEDDKPLCDDSQLLNGPALEGEGVDQDDVDLMLADEEQLFDAVARPVDQMQPEEELPADDVDDEPVQEIQPETTEELTLAEPEELPTTQPDQDDVQFQAINTDLDNLSQNDKLALFT
jgi:chemotaxis protein CheZ